MKNRELKNGNPQSYFYQFSVATSVTRHVDGRQAVRAIVSVSFSAIAPQRLTKAPQHHHLVWILSCNVAVSASIALYSLASQTTCPEVEDAFFWMVSECALDWNDDKLKIASNCTNGLISLPPVTGTQTGLVYLNVFCAICNGVENSIPWSYELNCRQELVTVSTHSGFEITAEVLIGYCTPCSFVQPNLTSATGQLRPTAVSCTPQHVTCLEREALVNKTSIPITEEEYKALLQCCTDGPHIPVTFDDTQIFRNQHCAMCNGINDLKCYFHVPILTEPGPSFSAILDVYGESRLHSMAVSGTVTTTCSLDEVFDPILSECRRTVCPEGYIQDRGMCSLQVNKTKIMHVLSLVNDTDHNQTGCIGGLIALNESEYKDLQNGTVLYDGEVYEVEFMDQFERPVICSNYTQNGTLITEAQDQIAYPDGFVILTYIGCSLSALGGLLILITYALFKQLQTLPSAILMNLAASIIMSNILVLSEGIESESVRLCTSIAVTKHLFFLAQFTWMTIMVFEATHTFYLGMRLSPMPSKASIRKLFILYFLIGWGIPLIIVATTLAVNFTSESLVLYGTSEDGTRGICWINHPKSIILAVVTPLAVFLLLNIILFTILTILLFKARRNEAKLIKNEKGTPYLRLYVAIASTTGLMWVFGFVAILARASWAWYVFILLNSTQGFVIFVAFLVNRRVGRLYLSLLYNMPSKQQGTNQTS